MVRTVGWISGVRSRDKPLSDLGQVEGRGTGELWGRVRVDGPALRWDGFWGQGACRKLVGLTSYRTR